VKETMLKTNVQPPAPEQDQTMIMELSLYSSYNRDGRVYTKGQQYRFRQQDALMLLQERDCGRPVWKIHQEVKKTLRQMGPVDVTRVAVAPVPEGIPGVGEPVKIEIGDDAEIADVLAHVDQGGENQTI
jgi:hypothetical protein